ncbi:MAG: hypothetical protein AAF502_06790 [Bacteroidota bacterium]
MTCIRPDGSKSWTKLNPGIEMHDFAHYVVERELKFENAFFGLIASGFDISDFELPRDQRPEALMPIHLPIESLQTEHIVNLLQVGFVNADETFDLIGELTTILAEKNLEFPESLDEDSLERINDQLNELLSRWQNLEHGETIELEFETTE